VIHLHLQKSAGKCTGTAAKCTGVKDGTKNLIRHVLTKHRDLEEIKGEIIANKLEGCKVRDYLML
jgi:hypothetical protein